MSPFRLLALSFASPAQCNAGIPIYSHGFGFFTGVLAFPVIIGAEAALLLLLSRSSPKRGKDSALKVSFEANLCSVLAGMFFIPFVAALFSSIWRSLAGSGSADIFMRQMFVAAYLVTIVIEAAAYHSSWAERRWTMPERRFWFWSLAVNSASYGVVAWLMVLGYLRHEDTAPWIWRLVKGMHGG